VVLTGWRPRRLGPAKAVSRQNGARDEDSARITQEDQAWDQTNDLMAHLASTGQNHCAEVLEFGQAKLRTDLMARMDRLQHRMDSLDEHMTVGLGHSLPVLKGLAVGRVGHSTANRKNLSFG